MICDLRLMNRFPNHPFAAASRQSIVQLLEESLELEEKEAADGED